MTRLLLSHYRVEKVKIPKRELHRSSARERLKSQLLTALLEVNQQSYNGWLPINLAQHWLTGSDRLAWIDTLPGLRRLKAVANRYFFVLK